MKWTSSSIWLTPIANALSYAANVFSGAYDDAPRWAMFMNSAVTGLIPSRIFLVS